VVDSRRTGARHAGPVWHNRPFDKMPLALASRRPEMSEQSQLLQNEFLNALRKDRIPVSVFLVNGIRLAGLIQSFDQYSIRLHGTPPQLVLKRVVATVVPDTKAARPRPAAGSSSRAPRTKGPATPSGR
jgi:host factor-I protein